MLINIALVLQRFQLELANPNYELELKSTLTIKPYHFFMKVCILEIKLSRPPEALVH